MTKRIQRDTGSFYTCGTVADYICKWAIQKGNETLLEPSFGDGQFIESAYSRYESLGNNNPIIYGVELQESTFEKFLKKEISINGHCGDFLDYHCKDKVDAVIGNPPYVSLKNLKETDKIKAIKLMSEYQLVMPTAGSLWMPFVVHSTEQISFGGKLGFVLPYELTYVRYAFKLWEYLKNNFGQITVIRVFDDFFPEVDVETVIFLAEDKGGNTDCVKYQIFYSVADLIQGKCLHISEIKINDIISMKKPFDAQLVSDEVWDIVERLKSVGCLSPILPECKFKIGYVSGNKKYFHPTMDDIGKYGISESSLIPCIINSKEINGKKSLGIDTSRLSNNSYLFFPSSTAEVEKEYISFGEQSGVSKGYKCRTRKPWFITPCVEIPDVILTVFGNVPRLMTNKGNFAVSNSLLGGFLKSDTTGEELVCRWYNSLTLLMIEIYIHSLGGGTLVLIPGEVDQLSVLSSFPKDRVDEVYSRLDDNMKRNGTDSTYQLGDKVVLKNIYGLTENEIDEIYTALRQLRSWRNPEERRGETPSPFYSGLNRFLSL